MSTVIKMIACLCVAAAGTVLVGSTALAQTISYNVDGDNDLAMYVGNASGTIFRQVIDKTTDWPESLTGSFAVNPTETNLYVLAMNFGGPGDVGGILNGVSLTDLSDWVYTDVTTQVTGFPSGEGAAFNPDVNEIQSLATSSAFLPSPFLAGLGTSSGILGTTTFILPDGNNAYLFRQSIAPFLAGASAPEPSSILLMVLGGASAVGIVRRRAVKST